MARRPRVRAPAASARGGAASGDDAAGADGDDDDSEAGFVRHAGKRRKDLSPDQKAAAAARRKAVRAAKRAAASAAAATASVGASVAPAPKKPKRKVPAAVGASADKRLRTAAASAGDDAAMGAGAGEADGAGAGEAARASASAGDEDADDAGGQRATSSSSDDAARAPTSRLGRARLARCRAARAAALADGAPAAADVAPAAADGAPAAADGAPAAADGAPAVADDATDAGRERDLDMFAHIFPGADLNARRLALDFAAALSDHVLPESTEFCDGVVLKVIKEFGGDEERASAYIADLINVYADILERTADAPAEQKLLHKALYTTTTGAMLIKICGDQGDDGFEHGDDGFLAGTSTAAAASAARARNVRALVDGRAAAIGRVGSALAACSGGAWRALKHATSSCATPACTRTPRVAHTSLHVLTVCGECDWALNARAPCTLERLVAEGAGIHVLEPNERVDDDGTLRFEALPPPIKVACVCGLHRTLAEYDRDFTKGIPVYTVGGAFLVGAPEKTSCTCANASAPCGRLVSVAAPTLVSLTDRNTTAFVTLALLASLAKLEKTSTGGVPAETAMRHIAETLPPGVPPPAAKALACVLRAALTIAAATATLSTHSGVTCTRCPVDDAGTSRPAVVAVDAVAKAFCATTYKGTRGELEAAYALLGNMMLPLRTVDELREAYARIMEGKPSEDDKCGDSAWKAAREAAAHRATTPGKRGKEIAALYFLACVHKVFFLGIPVLVGEERLYAIIALLWLAANGEADSIAICDVSCLLLASIRARASESKRWATPLLAPLFGTRFEAVEVTVVDPVGGSNASVRVVFFACGGAALPAVKITLGIDALHGEGHQCSQLNAAPWLHGFGSLPAFIEQIFSWLKPHTPPLHNSSIPRFLDSVEVIIKFFNSMGRSPRAPLAELVVLLYRAATVRDDFRALAAAAPSVDFDATIVRIRQSAATTAVRESLARKAVHSVVAMSARMGSLVAYLESAVAAARTVGGGTRAAASASAADVSVALADALAAMPPRIATWPRPRAMTLDAFEATIDDWTARHKAYLVSSKGAALPTATSAVERLVTQLRVLIIDYKRLDVGVKTYKAPFLISQRAKVTVKIQTALTALRDVVRDLDNVRALPKEMQPLKRLPESAQKLQGAEDLNTILPPTIAPCTAVPEHVVAARRYAKLVRYYEDEDRLRRELQRHAASYALIIAYFDARAAEIEAFVSAPQAEAAAAALVTRLRLGELHPRLSDGMPLLGEGGQPREDVQDALIEYAGQARRISRRARADQVVAERVAAVAALIPTHAVPTRTAGRGPTALRYGWLSGVVCGTMSPAEYAEGFVDASALAAAPAVAAGAAPAADADAADADADGSDDETEVVAETDPGSDDSANEEGAAPELAGDALGHESGAVTSRLAAEMGGAPSQASAGESDGALPGASAYARDAASGGEGCETTAANAPAEEPAAASTAPQ